MAIRPAQGAVLQRLQGEPAALELVLYHDVLCSWCYVADARLEYLRDEYGPLVRWRLRPYPLRPENQLPDKKERAVLARHFRRVSREREGAGITADLWTGADPPSSSLPPLVALEAALPQGSEWQRALLKAMRRAAFIEGINVARRDVQLELAAQVGLDLTRFVERLDDSHLEPEVTDSVEEAEALGIKGVPALVIGGEWLMQGCRDLTEYRQVIDKYLRERVAPAQMRMMH
ncbi:MAG: DsbA family protein [Deltaproteobacteria bacterium]|nr:MAG: DsbA family protein [Deltaproteobacteria bacterium]